MRSHSREWLARQFEDYTDFLKWTHLVNLCLQRYNYFYYSPSFSSFFEHCRSLSGIFTRSSLQSFYYW